MCCGNRVRWQLIFLNGELHLCTVLRKLFMFGLGGKGYILNVS